MSQTHENLVIIFKFDINLINIINTFALIELLASKVLGVLSFESPFILCAKKVTQSHVLSFYLAITHSNIQLRV